MSMLVAKFVTVFLLTSGLLASFYNAGYKSCQRKHLLQYKQELEEIQSILDDEHNRSLELQDKIQQMDDENAIQSSDIKNVANDSDCPVVNSAFIGLFNKIHH